MYTNADQFRRKFPEFLVRILDEKPMVIGITEVKPKNSGETLFPAEFAIDHIGEYDSPFHKNITTKTGRGILLYTHKSLQAKEVEMKTNYEEAIFVELKLNQRDKLLIGCFYRSDSGTEENNSNLRKMISEACSMSYTHLLFMGDFNYPDINWANWTSKSDNIDSQEFKFIECIRDNFLIQHVSEPTRVRGEDTPNLLDLIITNEKNMIDSIEYQSPLGKSDHSVLVFNFVCHTKVKNYIGKTQNFKKADYVKIKQELKTIQWKDHLETKTVNEQWEIFSNIITKIFDKYVPKRNIVLGKKKQNIPINRKVMDKIKEKHQLRRKAIQTKDPAIRIEYNRIRNQVRKLTRSIANDYEKEIAKNAKENPKAIWRYINLKSKTKEGIGNLIENPKDKNSKIVESDKEKAEVLANYFSSVFTKEPAGPIPILNGRDNHNNHMEDIRTTEDEVRKILSKLKPDKAPGPDNMHPYFLKETANELATPLSIIYNKSLETFTVPSEWKKGKITALFKKGSKKMASNYRPVSLTSIVCKCLEKIVRDRIIKFMKNEGLFSNRQYGFISGRSTSLQLLKVLDKWTEALDSGLSIDCIYMDYAKAFDTVPHRRLIYKLSSYGINAGAVSWIENFLENRTQQVIVQGEESAWKPVTSGIPQGSVLGPILFVIFINDLPESVTSEAYLFADDTKIFRIIKNEEDRGELQKDLNKLNQWSDDWLLKFHPQKCKYMTIGKNNDKVSYTLKDQDLQKVKEEKDIGVTIDDELDFESHISKKINKATRTFGMLRRSFNCLDCQTFLCLYKTMVRTHLDYASSVWAPYKMKHIEIIENVQRRCTRQLPNMKDLSYQERLKKLNLPTLMYRRLRGDMIETFKIVKGFYDREAASFLKMRSDIVQREKGRGHDLRLFMQRSTRLVRQKSFGIRIVSVWNNLPEHVGNSPNVNTFKARLDKHWENQDIIFQL